MNVIQNLIGKKIHRTLIGTQKDDDFDYIIRDITIGQDDIFILRCRSNDKHIKKWKFSLTEKDIFDLAYNGCVTRMTLKDVSHYKGIYNRDTVDLLCGNKTHQIEIFSVCK